MACACFECNLTWGHDHRCPLPDVASASRRHRNLPALARQQLRGSAHPFNQPDRDRLTRMRVISPQNTGRSPASCCRPSLFCCFRSSWVSGPGAPASVRKRGASRRNKRQTWASATKRAKSSMLRGGRRAAAAAVATAVRSSSSSPTSSSRSCPLLLRHAQERRLLLLRSPTTAAAAAASYTTQGHQRAGQGARGNAAAATAAATATMALLAAANAWGGEEGAARQDAGTFHARLPTRPHRVMYSIATYPGNEYIEVGGLCVV